MTSSEDTNGIYLTEAEDIKKRWYAELYKKNLHDPDNHNGVITHLEPDILECEVKWALESITINRASGGDGIPAELFQVLKDDAMKVLHSICQQICKTQQWLRDWKRSVFSQNPQSNAKECSNYHTIALISHASKMMLKILQARLQQYLNHEIPGVQAGFGYGSLKKQESSRKTSTSALLTTQKPLTMDHNKLENSERDGNTRPPYLPPENSVCRSKSKLDMEQQTGSKSGKE